MSQTEAEREHIANFWRNVLSAWSGSGSLPKTMHVGGGALTVQDLRPRSYSSSGGSHAPRAGHRSGLDSWRASVLSDIAPERFSCP